MKRRNFIEKGILSAASLTAVASGIGIVGCSGKAAQNIGTVVEPVFKLSLAQWSLHKKIFAKEHDPLDFATKAKALGFEGLEYVSQLYNEHFKESDNPLAAVTKLGNQLLTRSQDAGMNNVLIMIDGEGDTAVKNKADRDKAVENHKKWIDVANLLGCHSIRINMFGDGSMLEQEDNAAESMAAMADYAKDLNVNIIVENHGGYSSDPNWVKRVMEKVNRPNCGTLPDFGNFCLRRENDERWGTPCIKEYPDIYEAVEIMMPFAKAVSAKSYDFDEKGNETKIDYYKMLKVVKKAGYRGYVGVEYEGEEDEDVGIMKTKNLIQNVMRSI